MTQNNIKIAVTGGIGSGKTTVCNILNEFGFKVVSCDDVYKQIPDQVLKAVLEKQFLAAVNNDKIDKKKLAQIVFNDKAQLEKLNSLTHPLIMKEAFKAMEEQNILFAEVPLLFESGYDKYFNKIIVVTRDLKTRIESVVKRDNLSKNEVKNRINSQFNYDFTDYAKYYVIHNDGNIDELRKEVLKVIKELKLI